MLLPAAERRNELQFHLAKRLPYEIRLSIAFCLMAGGLVAQCVLLQVLMQRNTVYLAQLEDWLPAFGLTIAAILIGVSLLLTRGYQNVVRERPGVNPWQPTRREEIDRIVVLNKKQRAWDESFFDITCTSGKLGLLLVAALSAGLTIAAWAVSEILGALVAVDAAIMVLPFWVTGVRFILKHDPLVIKSGMLLGIEDCFNAAGPAESEAFQFQMQTAETADGSGQLPHDVKAMLQFHNAPESFLGLQMQVSINSVQGTDYPYFYCVIVARHEFKIPDAQFEVPDNIVVEFDPQADVNVIVIRQKTTKNSGYHTKQNDANRIFIFALNKTRNLLQTPARA